MGRWSRVFLLLLALALFGASLGASFAAAQRYHTVQRGQTLSGIAKRHRIAVWDLALANKLTPKGGLREGQTLQVPARGVTYVRPGQTLSEIARAHGCGVEELMRLNRLRRASHLRAGSRLVLPGFMPAVAKDRDWGEPARPGWVTIHRRDKRTQLHLVDEQGRVPEASLWQLAALMRRHEEDALELPHPRLARLLAAVSDHFGGRPMTLVSGFRVEAGYTSESSRHLAGRAADVQVHGVPRRLLWEYCRSLAKTGCGFYPRSVFVHMDVRAHHAQWVDWSAPGKRPRYGTLRRPYRRRERNKPDRPRELRRITRPQEVPLRVVVVGEHGNVLRVADERESEQPAVADVQQSARYEPPVDSDTGS